MQRLTYLLIPVFLYTFFFGCKNPNKPDDEEEFCPISDSTSHEFTFDLDTIGIFPSVLMDVDAINENNVWAVGEISVQDHDTIENPAFNRMNALKWNGTEYEYFQIPVNGYDGSVGIQRIDVVHAFESDNVWMFSVSGSYVHWNGSEWESEYFDEQKGTGKRIWASSPDNFYLVGDNGSITHYDGTSFTLMESGTDEPLHAITGYVDPENGDTRLWAAGPYILLHYDGSAWQTVWDKETPLLPDGFDYPAALYAPDALHLFVAAWKPMLIRGYCLDQITMGKQKLLFTTSVTGIDIAATALNDMFIIGDYGIIGHFNGNSVAEYKNYESEIRIKSLDYVNRNVYIVGAMGGQRAFFIKGERN